MGLLRRVYGLGGSGVRCGAETSVRGREARKWVVLLCGKVERVLITKKAMGGTEKKKKKKQRRGEVRFQARLRTGTSSCAAMAATSCTGTPRFLLMLDSLRLRCFGLPSCLGGGDVARLGVETALASVGGSGRSVSRLGWRATWDGANSGEPSSRNGPAAPVPTVT